MDSKNQFSPADRQFMMDFYEAQKAFLYHTARKFSDHQPDCEDIVQDAVLRLMRHIPTLRRLTPNQTAAYLFLTVRSAYNDRIRANQEPSMEEDPRELPDDSVQFAYDAKWDTQILKEGLSQKDWNLLEAKYILGYSDAEIARMLDCVPDSVRTLLRRARNRAKAVLQNRKEERTHDGTT